MRHYLLCRYCRDKVCPWYFENYIGPKDSICIKCYEPFTSKRKFWINMNLFDKIIFYTRVLVSCLVAPCIYMGYVCIILMFLLIPVIAFKLSFITDFLNSIFQPIEKYGAIPFVILYVIIFILQIYFITRHNLKMLKMLNE